MRHWLLKTEPSTFGIDQLEAAADKTTRWDGVRNYQARNFIRDQIRPGDAAFLYHSSCAQPAIVGIVRVVRGPYADATAFDRRDSHYDSASKRDQPRWFSFDIQLRRRLRHAITLEQLRAHHAAQLSGLILLRAGNRLSITPVEETHWRFILTLE